MKRFRAVATAHEILACEFEAEDLRGAEHEAAHIDWSFADEVIEDFWDVIIEEIKD